MSIIFRICILIPMTVAVGLAAFAVVVLLIGAVGSVVTGGAATGVGVALSCLLLPVGLVLVPLAIYAPLVSMGYFWQLGDVMCQHIDNNPGAFLGTSLLFVVSTIFVAIFSLAWVFPPAWTLVVGYYAAIASWFGMDLLSGNLEAKDYKRLGSSDS